ncbi:TonB-dependent hemoglobin/transferrin/lactoferrin family receptor [Alteromonas sediminis]
MALTSPQSAQSAENLDNDESTFETITVHATRSSRQINEIAATVSTYNEKQIDQLAARNIRDLVRYEPGVSVEGNGRYGLAGFNIRGINGDRVLILLDGVPMADEFSFGPFLSARRDFIDIDTIKQVEIIRGPASTLYGSDAIGGVVAFTSKDPSDYLQDGKTVAAKLKLGYDSAANEKLLNGQFAGVAGDWQWVIGATQRNSQETHSYFTSDNSTGTNRQSSDPQDNDSRALQAKLIYQPSDHHRLTIQADSLKGNSETQVLSSVDTRVRGVLIKESEGDDERERQRLQLSYQYIGEHVLLDKASLRMFVQATDNTQITKEVRFGLATRQSDSPEDLYRQRSSEFSQDNKGLIMQADKQFSGWGQHYLIYGMEWQQTDSEAVRNGSTKTREGALLPEFSVFPARDFPVSEVVEKSLFIQDEIRFMEGKLSVSPGVRYDTFSVTPFSDPLFENANPGVDIAQYDDSKLSAKLGTVYKLVNNVSVWLQFAQGFRIPPFDDVNIGFTNFAGGYTSLPNPNLEPESVDSWEVGIRANTDSTDWSVSAYLNDYDNFIESRTMVGFDPATQLIQFQATNRENVEIRGIDGQISYYPGAHFDALDGWRVQASASWLDSEDKQTGQQIESILPAQLVFGIGYGSEEEPWSVEVVATAVERDDSQFNSDPASPELFETPGYMTLDMLARIDLTKHAVLNLGLFNITDRQYWQASEVRGRTVEENLARFSSPGRSVSANIVYHF